jgi:hypothetical protein
MQEIEEGRRRERSGMGEKNLPIEIIGAPLRCPGSRGSWESSGQARAYFFGP